MEITIRERGCEFVELDVPERKHALVSQMLLKCSQNEVSDFDAVLARASGNSAQELRMDEQLARVEHCPPMRKSVIGDSPVVHMCHEPVWEFALRPKLGEVPIPSLFPFPG